MIHFYCIVHFILLSICRSRAGPPGIATQAPAIATQEATAPILPPMMATPPETYHSRSGIWFDLDGETAPEYENYARPFAQIKEHGSEDMQFPAQYFRSLYLPAYYSLPWRDSTYRQTLAYTRALEGTERRRTLKTNHKQGVDSDEVIEVPPDSAVMPAEPMAAVVEPAPPVYVEQEPVAVLSADCVKPAHVPVVPTTVVVASPPPPPPPPAPGVIMKKIHNRRRPHTEVRNVARHYAKESGRTSATAMVFPSADTIEEVPLILQYAAAPPPSPAYVAAPPPVAYVAPVMSSTYVARTPMPATAEVVATAPILVPEPVIVPVHHHTDTKIRDVARVSGREKAHTSATAVPSEDDLDFDDMRIHPVHDDYFDDVLDFRNLFKTLFNDLHFPAFRRARVVLRKTTLKTTPRNRNAHKLE